MAKDAFVSEQLADKFKAEKETPYTRWVAGEVDSVFAHAG